MTWEFRIIEGLQEGCNYSLEESTSYKVGSSYNCDILVLDQEDQEGSDTPYFEFMIQNGTVTLSNIQKIVQNHKNEIIYEDSVLNLPVLLSFLNIKAAICNPKESNENLFKILNQETKQDSEKDSNFPEEEKQDLESEESELIKDLKLYDDSFENKKETFMSKHFSKLKKITQDILSKAKEQAQALQKQNKLNVNKDIIKKYKHFVILAAIILVLCVVSFIAVGVFSGSTTTSQNNSTQTSLGIQVQGIKQVLLNLPPSFANIKVMPSKDGKLLIEGLVQKSSDVDLLKTKLKPYEKLLTYQVSTTDQAIGSIKQILKDKGFSTLTVAYDPVYSQITLSGIVSDMNVINDLELAISSQVPEIGSMDTNRIYASSDIEADFDKVIATNNYNTRLHINKNLTSGTISIGGYLAKNDIQTLKDNMDKLVKKYNNIISIDVNVKDIMYALPFKISVVYTGDNPMFITTDGRKVFQGGSIDGMLVEKITQDSIVFSGDYPLVYNLNSPFSDDENSNNNKTNNADSNQKDSTQNTPSDETNTTTTDLGL